MKKIGLFAVLFVGLILPASAATLDDVMAQLQAMQKDNQAIRRDNEAMRSEIASLRRERNKPEATVVSPKIGNELPRSVSRAMASAPAAGYYKAPAIAGPYDWTGFYFGANAGYAAGRDRSINSNFGPIPAQKSDGFLGGGQVGYNLQYQMLLLGIEADVQSAAIGGQTASVNTLQGSGVIENTRLDSFGTVRGRLGVVFDRWLVYGTGGFAAARTLQDSTFIFQTGEIPLLFAVSDGQIHTGWTAGGGIEYGFLDRWSMKAEYLHLDFGSRSYSTGNITNLKYDIGRVGVNYHLN